MRAEAEAQEYDPFREGEYGAERGVSDERAERGVDGKGVEGQLVGERGVEGEAGEWDGHGHGDGGKGFEDVCLDDEREGEGEGEGEGEWVFVEREGERGRGNGGGSGGGNLAGDADAGRKRGSVRERLHVERKREGVVR